MKKGVLLLLVLGMLWTVNAKAQTGIDTIRLMTYNVGNFGASASSQCPLLAFNLKSAYLRTILKYENPDIIGMVKMAGDQLFCTDSVINYVLDSVCDGCWGSGTYSTASTYPKENMLYFNTNKFGFVGSTVIYSADNSISDITLHKLFYKSPNLAITHDTIFFKVVLAHLLSGSGSTSGRASEVAGAMSWLNAHITANENLIFMGDLNTTASTEACFQDLINSTNINTKFFDPPNQLGQWSANPASFSHYLTQSTRTTDPGDCNATGGFDSRLDHILFTSTIKNGTDSIKYIPSSYRVIGQDGNHTGFSLLHSPTNTSVPANVNTALYYMSEHLPVQLLMKIGYSLSLNTPEYETQNSISIYPNPSNTLFTVECKTSKIESVKIYNVIGELVYQSEPHNTQVIINSSQWKNGVYFLRIMDEKMNVVNRKISIN